MPNIGPLELIIILVIALLILGPGKLPEVGASLGKSIREFRKAASDVSEATSVDLSTTPQPAAPAAPPAQVAPPAQAPVAAPVANTMSVEPVVAPTAAAPAPNVITEQTAPNEISTEVRG